MSPVLQPRFGEDAYPIGRLILDSARSLCVSRTELVRRLGYRKIGNGHKALAEALRTGVVPAHMRKHLSSALELDETVIDSVIEATSRQRQDEWRASLLTEEKNRMARFRPHLRTETARSVPQPIFVAALAGTARLRLVEVPSEIWEASADDRNRLVKRVIQDHYQARKAHVVPFGAILSYALVTMPGYLVDFGYPFDVAGNPTGPMQEVQRLGEAGLGVKSGRHSAERPLTEHRDCRLVNTDPLLYLDIDGVLLCGRYAGMLDAC